MAEFDIIFNEGISRIGSIIDLGSDLVSSRKKALGLAITETVSAKEEKPYVTSLRKIQNWPMRSKKESQSLLRKKCLLLA